MATNQLQPGLGDDCCCDGDATPAACYQCNVGTTHETYQLAFAAGTYTNNACNDCTALSGAVVRVRQSATYACEYFAAVTLGNCTFHFYFSLGGTIHTLTGLVLGCGVVILSSDDTGVAYSWEEVVTALGMAPPWDCGGPFTLAPNNGFIYGIPMCNGGLADAPGNVTVTGL